jgi:hypothetical protein
MVVKHQNTIAALILLILFFILVAAVYNYLPVNVDWKLDGPFSVGVDWKDAFRPAIYRLFNGAQIYGHGFYNPPWTLLPLLPIALLSPGLGAAVIFVLSIYSFAFVSLKLKKNLPATVALILSTVAVGGFLNGNVDFLVILGFIMPPWLGLFFVLMKPQLGFGVVAYWMVEAWQKGRFASAETNPSPISFLKLDWISKFKLIQNHLQPLLLTFAPVTAAYLITFLIWGFWPLSYENRTADPFNDSLWPHGLFIGLVILYRAIKTKDFRLAIISSPFLSPYVTNHGWAVALLGVGNIETILVSIGLWIFRFVFRNV